MMESKSLSAVLSGVAGMAAVAILGVSLRGGFVVRVQAAEPAQEKKSASDTYVGPTTPWGHPDLQGVWNNATNTPLERTTSEEKEAARRAAAPVRKATDGTGAGWLEPGGGVGASLVIDPPDGRIPMTAAAVKRLVEREE